MTQAVPPVAEMEAGEPLPIPMAGMGREEGTAAQGARMEAGAGMVTGVEPAVEAGMEVMVPRKEAEEAMGVEVVTVAAGAGTEAMAEQEAIAEEEAAMEGRGAREIRGGRELSAEHAAEGNCPGDAKGRNGSDGGGQELE